MWSALIAIWLCAAGATTSPAGTVASILVYHRFGPAASDAMTVRTSTFRHQLEYLQAYGYTVVPLRAVVGSEIARQIKAVEDFGADAWMLWNPRNQYPAADFGPTEFTHDGGTKPTS